MKQSEHEQDKTTIEKFKVWIDTLQGIATILAILAGGYWFFLQESLKPQVKLDQTVTQRSLAGESDQTYITVDVRTTNIGKVKVDLKPGELDLREVNPTPQGSGSLGSYPLKALILEPGESDQAIFQALIVPNSVKTIQVHSDYAVPGKTKEYWNLLSVVDLGTVASHKESATSVH